MISEYTCHSDRNICCKRIPVYLLIMFQEDATPFPRTAPIEYDVTPLHLSCTGNTYSDCHTCAPYNTLIKMNQRPTTIPAQWRCNRTCRASVLYVVDASEVHSLFKKPRFDSHSARFLSQSTDVYDAQNHFKSHLHYTCNQSTDTNTVKK